MNKKTNSLQLRVMPELLLPAGNREKMEAALLFGADAVYMAGEHFGLRAQKTAFGRAELAEAVASVHRQGRKAYVTMNIIAHEDDLPAVGDYARFLAEIGADAVIAADPGLITLVKEAAPDLELHLSTQASVCNSAACRFWYQQGVKRIVLARELTLAEIRRLRANTPPELEFEAFIHGAMCVAYSGRCLMSNLLTGRDANRGECAQPCRWSWRPTAETEAEGERGLRLQEDERGAYFFNSRDLCLIEYIPQLIEAGINSFKVEGRMKGAFYAAMTAKVYREAIDSYARDPAHYETRPEWLEELNQMVHRTYDTGFYFGRPMEAAKIDTARSYHREAAVVARAAAEGPRVPAGRLACEQRNKIFLGDELEIIRPAGRNLRLTVRSLYDGEGQPIEDTRHPTMPFFLDRRDLAPGDREEAVPEGSFYRRAGNKDAPKDEK